VQGSVRVDRARRALLWRRYIVYSPLSAVDGGWTSSIVCAMDKLAVELHLAVFEQFGANATIQDWIAVDATSRKWNRERRRAFRQWLQWQEPGSRFGASKCTVEVVNFLASNGEGEYGWLL
jgi:hypothetical protein